MPDEDRQFAADAPRYSSLRDYLRVLRERWILILACAVVVGGAAFAYSATQTKVYEAKTALNPQERSADIGLIGSSSGPPVSPQSLTAELAARSERDTVAKATAESLDGPLTPGQIASKVSASVDVRSNLVQIAARDSDPDFAAELANAYSDEVQREALQNELKQINDAIDLVKRQLEDTRPGVTLPDEIVILEERLNRLQTLKEIVEPVEVVTAATAPGAPISPKPLRNTALGLLAGLFIGILLAFVRDSLDTRLKSPREIEDQFELPRVGQLTDLALGRTISGSNGKRRLDPVDLEAARIMRTNLQAVDPDKSMRTLAITSALPAEGKSTVAMALAWASSIAGKSTLLVECDLRRSVLAERLGVRAAPGLTDAMLDNATPQEVLQPIEDRIMASANGGAASEATSKLVCITAGSPVPDPAEILGSKRFAEFLGQVSGVYDLVVLDTSPLLSVVDTRELLPIVDAILVCARSYQTTRDQARATREALAAASTRVAGLVVTGVKLRDDDYSSYYRRYVEGFSGASS